MSLARDQLALPVTLPPAQAPRLPEPREYEPYSEYLFRCVAVGARHWDARWKQRQEEVGDAQG